MNKLKMEDRKLIDLVPYVNNARTHTKKQIEEIAESILEFGFNDPVSIDSKDGLITGHGTVMACQLLVSRGKDYSVIPCIILDHLSERQKKAYILAHNRIAQNSGWDMEKLASEMNSLVELDFDINIIGFDEQELDGILKVDASFLPDEEVINGEKPEPTEKKTRKSKSKLLHTCPKCGEQFTA